jgi:hypothetical protein
MNVSHRPSKHQCTPKVWAKSVMRVCPLGGGRSKGVREWTKVKVAQNKRQHGVTAMCVQKWPTAHLEWLQYRNAGMESSAQMSPWSTQACTAKLNRTWKQKAVPCRFSMSVWMCSHEMKKSIERHEIVNPDLSQNHEDLQEGVKSLSVYLMHLVCFDVHILRMFRVL